MNKVHLLVNDHLRDVLVDPINDDCRHERRTGFIRLGVRTRRFGQLGTRRGRAATGALVLAFQPLFSSKGSRPSFLLLFL